MPHEGGREGARGALRGGTDAERGLPHPFRGQARFVRGRKKTQCWAGGKHWGLGAGARVGCWGEHVAKEEGG